MSCKCLDEFGHAKCIGLCADSFLSVEDQKRAQTVGLTELMRSQVERIVNGVFEDLSKRYKSAFIDGFNAGYKLSQQEGDDYE